MLSINRYMSGLFGLIFIGIFASYLYAGEYHVSKSGSDTNGNGSFKKPWLTISYALSKLSEGDVLVIHKGTYKEYNLKIRTSNVIIKDADGEEVIIDGGQNIYSKFPTIDIDKVDHVTLNGLKITGGGGIGCLIIGRDGQCKYIIVKKCEIWATGIGNTQNNPSIMRFYGAKFCRLENCKIYSNGIGKNTRTAIKIWSGASHLIIEHNEIFNIGLKGIDDKHGSDEGHLIIRYNYIHDIGHIGINLNSDYSIVEHNLIVKCGKSFDTCCISVYRNDGRPGGSFSYIRHNTIYEGYKGGILLGAGSCDKLFGCIVMDNIVVNCYRQGHPDLEISPYLKGQYDHQHWIDYNLYYDSKTPIVIREFDDTGYTLEQWRSYSLQDVHSIQADPLFVNKSYSFSKKEDFILSSDSPAKKKASDGIDMGADIFNVGVVK